MYMRLYPLSSTVYRYPPPTIQTFTRLCSSRCGKANGSPVERPSTSSLVRKRPRGAPVTTQHRYRASYRPHAGLKCDQTKLYLFFSRLDVGKKHVMDFSELEQGAGGLHSEVLPRQ